jgi:hypothetical protein
MFSMHCFVSFTIPERVGVGKKRRERKGRRRKESQERTMRQTGRQIEREDLLKPVEELF